MITQKVAAAAPGSAEAAALAPSPTAALAQELRPPGAMEVPWTKTTADSLFGERRGLGDVSGSEEEK